MEALIMCSNHNIKIVIMCFSSFETLIFTLEFTNNWVLCQINWVSIPNVLKIIEYLLKTYGYNFTWRLPLSLVLFIQRRTDRCMYVHAYVCMNGWIEFLGLSKSLDR